jgi:hypothetical protein
MGMRVGGSNSAAALQSSGVSNWQQRQQSFKSLSTALQSGNLGVAQAAFASLSSGNKAAANPSSPLAQIGQALKSGDLSAAQQAFSNLVGSRGNATAAAPASVASSSNLGSVINTKA